MDQRFRLAPVNRAGLVALGLAAGVIAIPAIRGSAAPVGPDVAVEVKQLEAWWSDLEKEEVAASRGLLELVDRPKEAVAFLKGKMKPLRITSGRAKALLLKLNSADEQLWRTAFEELEYFDPRLAIELPEMMDRITQGLTSTHASKVRGGPSRRLPESTSIGGETPRGSGRGRSARSFFSSMSELPRHCPFSRKWPPGILTRSRRWSRGRRFSELPWRESRWTTAGPTSKRRSRRFTRFVRALRPRERSNTRSHEENEASDNLFRSGEDAPWQTW
jgi:hypothetical protein